MLYLLSYGYDIFKCLTLLFFSTEIDIKDHQFQVCDRVNSRRVHCQSRWKLSVKWVSLSGWRQKHFICPAEATTGGSVVTFCRRWCHIFHFEHLRRRWAGCDPPAASPSPLHCVSEVFMAASSGRRVGTHERVAKLKIRTVSLTSSRGRSFAKLRSRRLFKGYTTFIFIQFFPSFAVVWGKLSGFIEQRCNNVERESWTYWNFLYTVTCISWSNVITKPVRPLNNERSR